MPVWFVASFALLAFAVAVARAQAPAARTTNAHSPAIATLPPVPTLVSPVSQFRQLLIMSPEDRARWLANRTPENRQRLLEKIREYRALGADECELRLQATELRWYLLQLLPVSTSNRPSLLASVPASILPLVTSRLEQWERLSPQSQCVLLTNDQAFGLLASAGRAVPVSNRLRAVSEERTRAVEFLDKLCTLTPAEKTRALKTLSETERREIEKTLAYFSAMSPEQRRECIRSYAKFTDMPSEEKKEFLRNAQRWEAMSPAERQTWRRLVNTMKNLPPLPAGFNPNMPPAPPVVKPRPPRPLTLATNQ